MKHPASPCNGVCQIDARTDRCKGCRRTLDEIADWPRLSPQAKRALLAELPRRKLQ